MIALAHMDQAAKRVLLIVVGFFAVIMVANGALAFFAFSSWSGFADSEVGSHDFSYNQVLERVQSQKALGWTAGFELKSAGGRDQRIAVNLKGQDGSTLSGARVNVRFLRPTTSSYDVETALTSSTLGRYTGAITLPLAGQWDVYILAEREGQASRWTTRIEIP